MNVLLNNYFGVVINAARGVAMQVSKAAIIFVSNFVSALNPRIMKLYAAGNIEASHRLASCASRYCFMLFWGDVLTTSCVYSGVAWYMVG